MYIRTAIIALLASAAPTARAGGIQVLAAPADGPIGVDGRLDEPDWDQAKPFSGLAQVFPQEGGAPGEATEVRVLRGEKTMYVGVRCLDSRPGGIVRPLGRRDSAPASDNVVVLLGSGADRRSALLFSLTAGGVQSDALVYDDDQVSYDWDGAWDGAVALSDDGWSAEFAIPLALMRDRAAGAATWPFGVVREIARSHEKVATFPLARTGSGMVTRLGTLGGGAASPAGPALVVAPYLAQRVQLRPQFSDPARARPRLADGSGDVGFDLHATVGRLALSATVNPDFGQVEADQVVLNLSTFETFFPEKRPFFTEGADAFQPVGAGRERVPQQLFYSRRVGQEAPILGAAKLVGQVGGLRIALLDGLELGTGQAPGATEDAPDRRIAWSGARPLHLGTADADPLVAPPARNFLAAVARLPVRDGLTLGAQAVSALPLTATCTEAQDAATDGSRPASCDAVGNDAAALDFNAASRDGAWYAYGQVAASRAEGGPPARTLRDGTVLRRGDLGGGAYLRAGKRGGEGLRADLAWTYASPTLELNAAGFQRTQNEQEIGTTVKYARTNAGPFTEIAAVTGGFGRWTTDRRALSRGWGAAIGVDAQLRQPYLKASFRLRYDDPMYDVREIATTGIPLRMPPTEEATLAVSTDTAKPLSATVGAYVGRTVGVAPLEAPPYYGASAGVAVRPHPRLETRLAASYDRNADAVRFLEDDGAGALLFGGLRAPTVSFTVRQLVVLSPRLTFQLYAQLFTAYESWGPFFVARPQGTAPVEPGALIPSARPSAGPDAHSSALVGNAVVRWEYRTGSTFYAVYARTQTEAPLEGGEAPHSLAPRGLGLGPTTDSVLVKWSYRFAR
ncbi:MAG TPA: DUF5916 domain-containing protein [Anaeromyxobacter sp.]|nr:DUF5916 domain-containing protein [Anaeromyxobacter sp.]